MRKKLIIGIVFTLIVTAVNAQHTVLKQIKDNLQFRAGISNTSNTKSFDDFKGTALGNRITLAYFGLESGYNFNKNIQLFYGLQLAGKGVKGSSVYDDGFYKSEINYKYQLAYIEMPVYIQKNYTLFSMNVGMVLSYLIKSNLTAEYLNTFPNRHQYYKYARDITSQFNRWDFGIRLGFMKVITQHLILEVILQKNFIAPNMNTSYELSQQQTFFAGIKYRVFK